MYWKKKTLAPSALLIYLGVKDHYPELEHHNLVFSRDWDKNFKQIFWKKKFPADPSFYVCNPNKTDPTVAPKGHENLFVLVPISAGTEYTDQQLEDFTDQTLQTMEKSLHLKNLRQNIVYKKTYCVRDFESDFNSYKGSALGLSHTLRQTAVFRPSNQHKKIPNLLFVGANTTPGIGLPMCLISAELAYKRVIKDSSSEPLEKLK
jgi:phytoene desaturase